MGRDIGKTFEELQIGEGATFTKTVTETDVILFAGISGDFNPLHMDEEYAKKTRFGRRIVHGALPFSLIAPVLGTKLPGMGTVVVEISVRFHLPTFIGDTITAMAKVKEKISEKKWVRMELLWQNQKAETIATGEALVIPPVPYEQREKILV